MTERLARDDEGELHDALGRWAHDHADRFDDIDVLPYDRARRPEQRLGTAKTAPALRGDPGRARGSLVEVYAAILGEEAARAHAAFADGLGGELREWLVRGGMWLW